MRAAFGEATSSGSQRRRLVGISRDHAADVEMASPTSMARPLLPSWCCRRMPGQSNPPSSPV
ncbi:MAG: hypothetical protein R2873_36475 [Caldilineaceae bacterium]